MRFHLVKVRILFTSLTAHPTPSLASNSNRKLSCKIQNKSNLEDLFMDWISFIENTILRRDGWRKIDFYLVTQNMGIDEHNKLLNVLLFHFNECHSQYFNLNPSKWQQIDHTQLLFQAWLLQIGDWKLQPTGILLEFINKNNNFPFSSVNAKRLT